MSTFVAQNDQHVGPFEDEAIRAGLRSGQFSPEQLAWREGMPDWVALRTLFPDASPADGRAVPPPLPKRQPNQFAQPPRMEDSAGLRLLLPVGRSGWAIAAGYAGLFALVIVPAPLALVLSLAAIWDIRLSRARGITKYGLGRAIFGLIAGLLGTAVLVMLIVRMNS